MAVGDETPRVHLEVETDDDDAEVARLVRLGGAEVQRIERWVVLRDPAGTAFCVVPVQHEAIAALAHAWG